MTDTDLESASPSTDSGAAPARTDMTVAEVPRYLRTWIGQATGQPPDVIGEATGWTPSGPVERVDIAVVGRATRLPGDLNSPEQTWQALLEGRDAITDLPEGRWSEFMEEPGLAGRIKNAPPRGGYLSDIKGFDSE